MTRVLVVASTFPTSTDDPVPAFVRDQIVAIRQECPDISFTVLAPHDARSHTATYSAHAAYDEHRFHYMWPFRFETLAGRGIVPALQQNPLRYALVPLFMWAECFTLYRLTRRLRPDVIYAHWFTPQGITAGIVSSLTGTPFVYTSHSSDVAILRKLPVCGPFAVRYFTKKARAVTVVSKRSLQKLQAFFSESSWQTIAPKIAVLPMGIAMPHVAGAPSSARPLRHILFMGRLAEKKGVQYLLPAFAKLHAHYPDAILAIAGDGPWRKQLEMQAKELHLSNRQVRFLGYVHGDEKAAAIREADICVVPSIITDSGDAEGLPVSLLEGMAAAKVCIATNESGADDIIQDGINGFLVPQKDISGLHQVLTQTLHISPEQCARIGRAAEQTARQFAWPVVARHHYQHLFQKP